MTRLKPAYALVLLPLLLVAVGVLRATAVEPGNEYFERTWARTDLPVANGVESRTWMWGPEAYSTLGVEPYLESPGGQREIQYFEKARMEIPYPGDDPNSIWYVTNGLLVVELMTGRLQLGDNTFEQRSPAIVNVAGDADDPNGPTYAGMSSLRNAPPLGLGSTVTQRVSRGGNVTSDGSLASYGVTVGHIDGVTNHSIASPFWTFMNSSGTVYSSGQYVSDLLFENPYFATGRPIIEPYWALVQVGGIEREVLTQCFERRCLTYTPDNQPGWQVEAGNVGIHYYNWRYGNDGGTSTPTATATVTASPTGTVEPSPTETITATATETVTPTATIDPDSVFYPIDTCGGPAEPNAPEGIAIAADGSIYVADTGNHQVAKLSSNGQYLMSFGESGFDPGQFDSPHGIEVDSFGNVYVADYGNDRVQIFNSSGEYLDSWGSTGSGNGQFDGPFDVSIYGNTVYVTDYNNDRIQAFSPQGQYLTSWGGSGSGAGQFDGPMGIETSSNGDAIYVVDSGNYRVQRFDASYAYNGELGSFGTGNGQFLSPSGIAVNPGTDNVYISDRERANVQMFNLSGSYQLSFGSPGSAPGYFMNPGAIAVSAADNIWVADRDNRRVQHLSHNGPTVEYESSWQILQDGDFAYPDDVAVDANSYSFVVDRAAHRVTRFEADCSLDRVWGGYGSGNSEYDTPVAVGVSPNNLIHVVDQGNHRIQVTSNIGSFVREWGEFGSGQGQFNMATDLDFGPTGDVYVVDSGNNRIQIFSDVGVYQGSWGSSGSGPGQFNDPRDIVIANNQVYVTDYGNERVQIFDLSGAYVGQLTAPQSYDWSSISDVAADPNGYIYVLAEGWYYVHNPQDAYLSRHQTQYAAGSYINGNSLAFGPDGRMYVVDAMRPGLYLFSVSLI